MVKDRGLVNVGEQLNTEVPLNREASAAMPRWKIGEADDTEEVIGKH